MPAIYQKYNQEKSDLHQKYRKAETKPEKAKYKAQAKAKYAEFKQAFEAFLTAIPLVGKTVSFKASDELPFVVQQVKITSANPDEIKFIIQTKVKNDIKDSKGEISQRMKVHFFAFNSKNKVIPKTGNYATSFDWIKLTADTIYEAKAHWNSNRIQEMGDFSFINIISKAEYTQLKKIQ